MSFPSNATDPTCEAWVEYKRRSPRMCGKPLDLSLSLYFCEKHIAPSRLNPSATFPQGDEGPEVYSDRFLLTADEKLLTSESKPPTTILEDLPDEGTDEESFAERVLASAESPTEEDTSVASRRRKENDEQVAYWLDRALAAGVEEAQQKKAIDSQLAMLARTKLKRRWLQAESQHYTLAASLSFADYKRRRPISDSLKKVKKIKEAYLHLCKVDF